MVRFVGNPDEPGAPWSRPRARRDAPKDTTLPASTHLRTPVHPLLLGGLVLALVGFLLLPGSFASKLLTLVAGVCAQRPAHSYFMGGGLLPPPPLQALLLGFVALMAVDGTNALFYDTGWPSLYPPNNAVRLATGLLCGLALALLAVPVLSATLWRDWDF